MEHNEITRRGFLAKAAAIGATALLAGERLSATAAIPHLHRVHAKRAIR